MPEKVKSGKGKTSAGRHLTRVVGDAYMDLHAKAAQGAFVVWIAINVPAELFLGFENVVYGVPSVMIDADHADARKYSKGSTFTRLEALLEQIEAKRAA